MENRIFLQIDRGCQCKEAFLRPSSRIHDLQSLYATSRNINVTREVAGEAHIVPDDGSLTAALSFCQCNLESFGIDSHFSGNMQTHLRESSAEEHDHRNTKFAIVHEQSV